MNKKSSTSFMEEPLLQLLNKSPDEMSLEELEKSIELLRSTRINNHVVAKKISGEAKPKKPKGKAAKETEPESVDISMFIKK